MSAGVGVGAGAGSSAASSSSISIPTNARKVVQDLKEIVKNSDDEIYAMLKECNMDPNETVQRLLSQDTFHEVKRKRDKKKENTSKESAEIRTHAPGIGSSARGGRAHGRGNYAPRYISEFSSSGRGQAFRDNSLQQNGRASIVVGNSGAPIERQVQSKTLSSVVAVAAPGSTIVPNGSSQYSRVVQGSHNNIGPGQATMAKIVKAGSAKNASRTSCPTTVASEQQLRPPDGALSSVSDPVLHTYVDGYSDNSVVGGNKGLLGLDRSTREITSFVPVETGSATGTLEELSQTRQASAYCLDTFSSVGDTKAVDSEVPSTSMPSSLPRDLILPSEVSPEVSSPASSMKASQFNGSVVYQAQPQILVSEKGPVEWRPKSPVKTAVSLQLFNPVNEAASRSSPSQDNMELLMNSTMKLQQLNVSEDQPVIIPDHLQVPEVDRTHLSFGSFGQHSNANSNFVDEEDEDDDDKKSSVSEGYTVQNEEAPAEQLSASRLVSPPVSESYDNQLSSLEALVAQEDVKINISMSSMLPVSKAEVTKAEPQEMAQHPIMSAMHGYTGTANAVPQIVGGQLTYGAPEPQMQEVTHTPSFLSYTDPSSNTNYYSPMLRPSSDLDARYAQFVSAGANKYTPGFPLLSGQGLSFSQEGGNSTVHPTSGPAGQASQTVGLRGPGLTIPQQHIPIHAYPAQHAGVPLTPFGNGFGIHYVPTSYGYMHSPYQHGYTGNTGYQQAPGTSYAAGNNYAPAVGAAYASTGAAAMKYALPQYRPGVGAGNAPHAALATGYGNFGTSPSGFTTINSTVTSATASGYEDTSGPQFKENNPYMHSQQPSEGSGVWIQNLPSRDITGLQTNSYYNLLNQGQHTSFAHTQPIHAVPASAYASLYHQSQSGSAPGVHQLLPQPQALGAVGVGVQSVAYPQQQRGQQQSWTPNY